ncbi:hypothetical protein PTKIN_Ptkin13bG0209300 [Pterospermum kingtungense]
MSVIAFTVFFRTKMQASHISNGVKFYGALFFSLINVMFNGMAELALTIFRLPSDTPVSQHEVAAVLDLHGAGVVPEEEEPPKSKEVEWVTRVRKSTRLRRIPAWQQDYV